MPSASSTASVGTTSASSSSRRAAPCARGRLLSLLEDESLRPAIVYVPTRKLSESLAEDLGKDAVSYHAGMDNGARERSQRAFTEGNASVVVATSAFGMGIDKANVRTVVHMGLPSSVEAYYQEIGRAGRDGKPARAILFYSWADRKLQESLFDRSYPATPVLQQVYRLIGEYPMELDELQMRARCSAETFDRALDQLRSTEAVVVAGWPTEVSRGPNVGWARDYDKQRARKRGELEDMTRLIEASGCRMCGLVGHFGDRLGSTEPCGHCDICAPDRALARTFRACTDDELTSVERVVDSLRDRRGVAKGRLFNDLPSGAVSDRKAFERIVDGLIRAGLARPETCRFDKDGKEVAYVRLHLTEEGWEAERPDLTTVQLEEVPVGAATRRKKKPAADPVELDATGELVADALRAWRGRQARERGVPAFMVLNNRALASVAAARPQSPDDLLGVHGIGPRFIERYGEEVLKLVRTEVAHG
jgi:superfamily II DNA helicase RecQ